VSYHNAGATSTETGQGASATTTIREPSWAKTGAQLKAEGQLTYADRPVDVQAIMRHMYLNDAHYRTLSGLFVDRSPGDVPSSLRVYIQQPDAVHTASYANVNGTGTPTELYKGEGQVVTLYAPSRNVYTNFARLLSNRIMDLASVPLGVVQKEHSGTTLYSGGFAGVVPVLADMYLHPASLLLSPFFANKDVESQGKSLIAGRSAWKLHGKQVPGASQLGGLGDAWTMWVDVQSGIILHLDYYSGSTLIGWAGLQHLQIDGSAATAPNTTRSGASSWAIPSGAHLIKDPADYDKLAQL
jgi:hypothetical protein